MDISWFLFVKFILVLLFFSFSCVDNDAKFFKECATRRRKKLFIAWILGITLQNPRCDTFEHVVNEPHPWMNHLARSISHTSLWVVDNPWPTIACQRDSLPSHYWYSHSHYTLKQSTISRMNKTQKYSPTQHHHTWLLKYFHEASKAQLISI